jgi:hypothetical protein
MFQSTKGANSTPKRTQIFPCRKVNLTPYLRVRYKNNAYHMVCAVTEMSVKNHKSKEKGNSD